MNFLIQVEGKLVEYIEGEAPHCAGCNKKLRRGDKVKFNLVLDKKQKLSYPYANSPIFCSACET